MIQRPETLIDVAGEAGIQVPADIHNYKSSEFPHWHVFCMAQMDRPMPKPDSHVRNAKIIAAITPEEIAQLSLWAICNRLE